MLILDRLIKFILNSSIALGLYLFGVSLVLAQSPSPSPASSPSPYPSPTCVDTDLGCISQDPARFASQLYGIGLGFIGTVGVLFIIYGGYLILASKGDHTQLARGRSYIVSAIIGIVLAISGFAFYHIIAADIVKLPGFK